MSIYTEISVSGYNASPPPDDGSTGANNEVTWTGIKTKIGDPLKTAIEDTQSNITTAAVTLSTGMPPGIIGAFATETVPTGWLECTGQFVSRTTYASLFAAIGTRHGAGNGTTTFAVPNYRGYFLRGWDHGAGKDPDSGSRTDSGNGTVGDHVGTQQDYSNKAHTHSAGSLAVGTGVNVNNGTDLMTDTGGTGTGFGGTGTGGKKNVTAALASGAVSGTSASTGGAEARPANITVMYCIFAGVA